MKQNVLSYLKKNRKVKDNFRCCVDDVIVIIRIFKEKKVLK